MSREGACVECGSTHEVWKGLCEECEADFTWCDCCKAWQPHGGDGCRNVFWCDAGYGGAGSSEVDYDYFKESFFELLDSLAKVERLYLDKEFPDLIAGIEWCVRKHAFWTKTVGPMLGTPNLLFVRERPDLPRNRGEVTALSFATVYFGDLEQREEAADGFGWLQSLCAGDTKKANRQTVKWIKEWRRLRQGRKG